MIVGTAGHVDHGKTALVRALTGVDTDRLPEEKRRGITIELGFAPLPLPGLGTLGMVDVPGHEAFVRTMLAGASGIDVALLVVAADEGVMPQTREHLAILSLLAIPAGVVAVTKCDLVDPEWLALVIEDVRGAVAGTSLADAPVIATSATTGEGLGALREALGAAMRRGAGEAATGHRAGGEDLFRMPVDRAFSVRGTGTVVTGTVWSGTLRREAVVRLLPGDRSARVRGLQVHGAAADGVGPGTRAAVALVGVDVGEVPRGATLVTDAAWSSSRLWRADVHLLDEATAVVGARTNVRVHLGTADVGGRIVAAGGTLEPGARGEARVVLDAPIAARGGDRFVLRGGSPLATLGGGVILDPAPSVRRPRPWPPGDRSVDGRLGALLAESGADGVAARGLPVRLGVPPALLDRMLRDRGDVLRVGGRLVAASVAEALRRALLDRLVAWHREAPLEAGMSVQALRASVAAPPDVCDAVLAELAAAGAVTVDGALVRERGWAPTLTPGQQALAARLAERLAAAGLEAPTVTELTTELGREVPALLALAERQGMVVALGGERYCDASSVAGAVARLEATLVVGAVYQPGALREALGISRKHLMSLLEQLDRQGVTERAAEGRRWRGGGGTSRAT